MFSSVIGSHAVGFLLEKERDHRPAAAQDVAVTDDREPSGPHPGHGVAGYEKLVGAQFRGPVKVDGVGGFVGAQRDDLGDPLADGGTDDVLATKDVGLDGFKGVVLGGGHLLERRGVDDDVDPAEGFFEAFSVANIPDEVPQAGVLGGRIDLGHLKLLEFVPREDDQLAGLVAG